MKIKQVQRIIVIGAGTMGQQISLQCAMHGYEVIVYDLTPNILDHSLTQINRYAAQFVANGRFSRKRADAALARITMTTNPTEAAAEADVLSESVPEDPELKAKVFAQFNDLCPPRTIFTTNTSSLVPSMYAAATGRPAQFAALHFHQFVWDANVVDIMPHPGTSQETIKLLHAFAQRIGQIPIFVQKENRGYVFNAMLDSLLRAAVTLNRNNIASVKDIDRSWMGVTKMSWGLFAGMDVIGLDVIWHAITHRAKQTNDPEDIAYADFIKQYVDKGWLGVKSGRGFYTYPNPAYQQSGFLLGEDQPRPEEFEED